MSLLQRRDGLCLLVVEERFEAATRALGWPRSGALAEALANGRPGNRGSGRGATRVLELPGHTQRIHLRPLRHGGVLRSLWRDRMLGLARAHRELELCVLLRTRAVPIPEPLLLLGEQTGLFWRGALGTQHLDGVLDGAEFLASRPVPDEVLRAARAAGSAVRKLHDAGGRHGDLHVGNLLLRPDAALPEVLLIDFDAASLAASLTPAQRMQELMRLYRSLIKRDAVGVVGQRGCAAFFSAYLAGDRVLRRAMLAQLGRERLRIALHALGYRRFHPVQ